MQRRLALAAVGMTLIIGPTELRSSALYCMQPNAPSLYLSKPNKPFCASTSDGCSRNEVNSYRSSVESYYRRLERYATDVNEYYRDARAYVKCMADLD